MDVKSPAWLLRDRATFTELVNKNNGFLLPYILAIYARKIIQVRENYLVNGKKKMSLPFLKRVERMNEGNTELSASPVCQGRSWKRSS